MIARLLHLPQPRTLSAFALICCLFFVAGAAKPPGRSARGKSPVALAIETLVAEARGAMRAQKLPRDEADFAQRYEGEAIGPDDLLAALTQRTHSDSFIDAYVRWQLTSFDPALPQLDDRAFLKLMAAAPPMVENPRADSKVVDLFQRAQGAGRLSEGEVRKLRDTAAELDRRALIADAFNRPAELYRDWIESKLPESGPRRLQWLVERTAAITLAGRPSRTVKGDMTRACKAAALDRTLLPPQREMIEEQIRRLIGLERMMVESVGFLASGGVEVKFVTARISKGDAEKWIGLLMGTEQ